MIQRLMNKLGLGLLLLWAQFSFSGSAALSAPFFTVSATGNISITLCLNAKGPLSCQDYKVPAGPFSIRTTIPNHNYPIAGIKINTAGFSLANLGGDCTPGGSGYCSFPVSDIAPKTMNVIINGPLLISPSTLSSAILNTPYSQTVTASGGVAPYTYTITLGSLPPGLLLNDVNGVISGIPTSDGTYNFTVMATDSNAPPNIGSKPYTLVVTGSLILSPSTLPAGLTNVAYNQTITASGGVGPYTFSVTSGALPPGLTLTYNGNLTGTPTTVGFYSFTITATDTNSSKTGSQAYSLALPMFTENFDSVTAGTLPSGWTVGGSGSGPIWRTVTSQAQTPPNSIFTRCITGISDRYIISPSIALPSSNSTLSFYNYYNTEQSFDGGVLEIDINNTGTFTDIITAGGSFITGGYNNQLDSGNPLGVRMAWSGNSGGFILTSILMPSAAMGLPIKLRWQMGCDNSGSSTGWWVDTISIAASN